MNSSRKGTAEELKSYGSYKNYLNDIKAFNLKRKREDDELHRKAKILK